MSHMSTLEKAKLQIKSLKKAKASKKAKMASISLEERERIQSAKYNKTLREEVDIALYDFSRHQYPRVKYAYLKKILTDYLKELRADLRVKMNLADDYTLAEKEEILKNRNSNINKKIDKIEGVINEINK